MTDAVWFATVVTSSEERWCIRLLLESIRAFGGPMAAMPGLLCCAPEHEHLLRETLGALPAPAVQLVPLAAGDGLGEYPFADKVAACFRAEELAAGDAETLIWFDPRCLVVNTPELLRLDGTCDAAVRPVHIRNVGARVGEPLDGYWRGVYDAAGIADVTLSVESYVDAQSLRAYFNCGTFAVNPALGLMRRWHDTFARLVRQPAFQASACGDELHRIFLHQAAFSAVLASGIEVSRLRNLPPAYGYPVHLHHRMPPERRPAALNDLVCIMHEDLASDALSMNGLGLCEPLAGWLRVRAAPLSV